MSCRVSETTLALYVEGDLADREARVLGEHLAGCEHCRARVVDLTASQRQLKSLKESPLDAALVEQLHAAVMEAVSGGKPRREGVPPWRWALAASLVALVVAGSLLWRATPSPPVVPPRVAPTPAPTSPSPTGPILETRAQGPTPQETSPRTRRLQELAPSPPVLELSTAPPPPAVSRGLNRETSAPRLSADDADRLARALVAVSKIHALPRQVEPAEPEGSRDGTLVRWTTADPNVVLYWQLDSNGG
jgi:hypothetical protein